MGAKAAAMVQGVSGSGGGDDARSLSAEASPAAAVVIAVIMACT
jgi:hypothetical protein